MWHTTKATPFLVLAIAATCTAHVVPSSSKQRHLQRAVDSTTLSGKQLCADPEKQVFVALASDVESYDSIEGYGLNGDGATEFYEKQKWEVVTNSSGTIRNSFTGNFLQVLPDSGHTYPARGQHIVDVKTDLQLGNAPYLNFRLSVRSPGWHTMFARWTGGDSIGGGDSFYVSMFRRTSDQQSADSQELITGQRTLKPSMVPIDSGAMPFVGCCYDPNTHACPCYEQVPPTSVCNATNFMVRERASSFGIQCAVGPGIMQFVEAPHWYLYAGQAVGNLMDFNAEPWDATCEAEGSNTADSGKDFAAWELAVGEYDLRIYAREDGTALDAVYVAGPGGLAPGLLDNFQAGGSTFCEKYPQYREKSSKSKKGGSKFKAFLWILFLSVGATLFIKYTEIGQHLGHRASMAYRATVQGEVSREAILQYEPMHSNM